jgi:hypothetical protein
MKPTSAIKCLSQFCIENKINNVTPIKGSALGILDLAPFDFVFGNMALHHIEPFEDFSDIIFKQDFHE